MATDSKRALSRRRALSLATLGLALFALPSVAQACSCMRQSVAEQAKASSVIFIGKPISTKRLDGMNRLTTFRVTETLKGSRLPTRAIFHWRGDGGNCGIEFRSGERMLITARRFEGKLQVNACSMPMGSEAEFRAALGRK